MKNLKNIVFSLGGGRLIRFEEVPDYKKELNLSKFKSMESRIKELNKKGMEILIRERTKESKLKDFKLDN